MLTSFHLHKKSSEVSIKTRSTPALLSIQARTLSTQLKNGLFHLCHFISNLGTAALTKEHRILYLKFHCATYLGNHDSEPAQLKIITRPVGTFFSLFILRLKRCWSVLKTSEIEVGSSKFALRKKN